MLMTKVGLVDMTGKVDAQTMTEAAAALNIQVTRDLPQFWPITATVEYLPDRHHIPQGVWPVQLVDHLPPGEGGFHQTAHGQPYAKVVLTPGSNEWTVDASHETIEMLVDPSGNRLQTSVAIIIIGGNVQDATGKFEYLVEACDPCEADDFTYVIDGISVSDFITPHFYDAQATPGSRYSFTGGIKRPREILKGGYISFVDPEKGELQQILWVDPSEPPQLNDLGPVPPGMSLRVHVENKTRQMALQKRAGLSPEKVAARKADREKLTAAAAVRAKHYK
ncbi:MAG: hypothetical protein JO213_20865 [Alphaproteobacteria bacterium]|nr:hypothetical protein [Alphaproteobacteria bacterium]MBV9151590.1 hypothetical protein [Alphaproteobacteria bacterium]MBV9587334.1 hypothetical protein [Alphaproteobacteria bacterium]